LAAGLTPKPQIKFVAKLELLAQENCIQDKTADYMRSALNGMPERQTSHRPALQH
jgi:hypothetical protein